MLPLSYVPSPRQGGAIHVALDDSISQVSGSFRGGYRGRGRGRGGPGRGGGYGHHGYNHNDGYHNNHGYRSSGYVGGNLVDNQGTKNSHIGTLLDNQEPVHGTPVDNQETIEAQNSRPFYSSTSCLSIQVSCR